MNLENLTPEEKKKNRLNKWRLKNKEHLKKYRKKYYQKNKEKLKEFYSADKKELRELSKELGNCTKCFKPKNNPKYKYCLKCRILSRENHRKYRRIK